MVFCSFILKAGEEMEINHRKRFVYISVLVGVFCLLLAATASAHSWMAPEGEASRMNPVEKTRDSVEKGAKLFGDFCAFCHGQDAKGLKKQETGLSMDTPDLPARLATHSDGDFHWKILNGKGDMPSFEGQISETDVWHVINFLKSK